MSLNNADPWVEPFRHGSQALDGPRRQVDHGIDEQDAGWRSQGQGQVHQVVNAYCVVELLQVDHAEGCVHTALCSCLSHGTSDQTAAECRRSFDCLVPRANTLSAPRLHRGLADFLPYADQHWEEAQWSVSVVGFGLSIIDVPNTCHGQDLVEDVGELLAAPVRKGEEVGWSERVLSFACSSSRCSLSCVAHGRCDDE